MSSFSNLFVPQSLRSKAELACIRCLQHQAHRYGWLRELGIPGDKIELLSDLNPSIACNWLKLCRVCAHSLGFRVCTSVYVCVCIVDWWKHGEISKGLISFTRPHSPHCPLSRPHVVSAVILKWRSKRCKGRNLIVLPFFALSCLALCSTPPLLP